MRYALLYNLLIALGVAVIVFLAALFHRWASLRPFLDGETVRAPVVASREATIRPGRTGRFVRRTQRDIPVLVVTVDLGTTQGKLTLARDYPLGDHILVRTGRQFALPVPMLQSAYEAEVRTNRCWLIVSGVAAMILGVMIKRVTRSFPAPRYEYLAR